MYHVKCSHNSSDLWFDGVRPRMQDRVLCRHELLDRCLIWNERHLRQALREYERFSNEHRASQAPARAAPLRAAPDPITDRKQFGDQNIRRRDRLGRFSMSTLTPLDLRGRSLRQAQSPRRADQTPYLDRHQHPPPVYGRGGDRPAAVAVHPTVSLPHTGHATGLSSVWGHDPNEIALVFRAHDGQGRQLREYYTGKGVDLQRATA